MSSNLKAPTQTGSNVVQTTNAPPSYVQDAQRALLSTGASLTAPFLQNAPTQALAGFTPDQQMAFDLARTQAQQAYTQPTAQVSQLGAGVTPASASAASAQAAQVGSAAQWQAAMAQAALAQAAQLGAPDIQQFISPYQQDVVDTSVQQLSQNNDRQLAAVRARQAAEGAYGGNRGALQESEQNRNFGNTLAQTVAGLYDTGFGRAAQLGMGNAQMRQQTALSNQSAENTVNLANQNWTNQASQSNTAATNSFAQLQAQLSQQANMLNASNQQQANMANAGYQQQAGMFNAQQPLAAAALQGQLDNQSWQQKMGSLQALLGTGGMQQQFAQQALNVPFTALDNFAKLVPSAYGNSGSTSTPIYGPSTFQSIASLLPAGIAGASALFGASDRSLKTDIQKLGKDERTGLDQYAYRYKGDPKNTMKVVGPMAQDVEKKYPGSTERIGGKLAIKGNARQLLGI